MSYWFNELPSDWNVVKVKNVFNMISGGTPKSDIEEYWSDSEVIWVTPEDLSKEGKYLNDSIRKISNLGLQNCSANVIKANSIVVSTRAPIGNVKVSTVPFTTNQGCKSLEAKGKVNITYYYYVIALAKEHLNNLGQGTTFLELSNYSLKNVFVPYPDINLQDLIAYYLDTKCNQIDELIVAKKKQISLLEQQRQSIITEAVTKGLNPNVKMKDSGVEWIGEIPEHWEVTKIKYTTYVKGRIGWQGLKSDEFIDKGPFLVTGTDFLQGYVNWDTCYHISEKRYNEAPPIQLQENDLLITKDGTIGKLAIVKEMPYKAILNSGVFVTRPFLNKYLSKYMYWLLSSAIFDKYIKFMETGSTIKHLYQETFVNFSYPIPSTVEQTEILNYLDIKIGEIDSIKSNLVKQIEKLKEYRQALIYEAVTGKIDVRDMELDLAR